jgi:hypothetical protein
MLTLFILYAQAAKTPLSIYKDGEKWYTGTVSRCFIRDPGAYALNARPFWDSLV